MFYSSSAPLDCIKQIIDNVKQFIDTESNLQSLIIPSKGIRLDSKLDRNYF